MRMGQVPVRIGCIARTHSHVFGGLIAVVPFRRRERWAWFTLWFYPLFWLAHPLFRLPPGNSRLLASCKGS
jgi:hypothetical protein